MNAIKVARRFIETDPTNESAKILARLVLALESDRQPSTPEEFLADLEYALSPV